MFYQYPWWRHYGEFSRYMSRLSETLTGGRHVAKIAMLWPINSMFAEYLPQGHTEASDTIESGLNTLTDLLLRLHHDFDYLDEDVLAAAKVDDGRVVVGGESYELVIMPPMTHLRMTTIEALERFVDQGGRTLGVLRAPTHAFTPQGLADIAARVERLFGGEGGHFIEGDGQDLIGDAREGGRRLRDALDEGIRSLIQPDIGIGNDEVFSLHREKDDRHVHLVINPTFHEQSARVTLPGDVLPVLLDPSTGDEVPVGPLLWEDGHTSFELTLSPVGSTFVVVGVSDERRIVGGNVRLEEVTDAFVRAYGNTEDGWIAVRVNGHVARASARAPALPEPLSLSGTWRFEPDGLNAAVLRRWEASPEREGAAGSSPNDADPEAWKPMGPGAWSYQLVGDPERRYPIPVWYRIGFDVRDVPTRLELVIDGFEGSSSSVWLNDRSVTAAPVRASFDAQMRSVDLTQHVIEGLNVLAVRLVLEEPTDGLLDNVKLMGTFSLAPGPDDTFCIVRPVEEVDPAPWTAQGSPFFSGSATYRRDVTVPDGFAGHRLFLDVPMKDDVLEVHVNGRPAGIRLWDPYEVEVTDLLKPGSNEVAITVTNTLANLLNGVDRPSGMAGVPRLVARASFEFDLSAAVPTGSEA